MSENQDYCLQNQGLFLVTDGRTDGHADVNERSDHQLMIKQNDIAMKYLDNNMHSCFCFRIIKLF